MPTQTLTDTIGERFILLEIASRLEGRFRERIVALHEADAIYCRAYPECADALRAVRLVWPLDTPPASCKDLVQQSERHLIGLLQAIARKAIVSNALRLPTAVSPTAIVVTMWAEAFGMRGRMPRSGRCTGKHGSQIPGRL